MADVFPRWHLNQVRHFFCFYDIEGSGVWKMSIRGFVLVLAVLRINGWANPRLKMSTTKYLGTCRRVLMIFYCLYSLKDYIDTILC